MDTLKKIYGEKTSIGLDIKRSQDKQWIRDWINTLDHKNDKHTVIISDGTQNRTLDIFDIWSGFPEDLKKGIKIY